jgi:hypothetical protein
MKMKNILLLVLGITVQLQISSQIYLPGKVEAEDYFDIKNAETKTIDSGLALTHFGPGDYAIYDVEVVQSGDYTMKFRVSTRHSGTKALITAGEDTILMTDVLNTGGWSNYQTFTTPVTLTEGRYEFKLQAINDGFNVDYFKTIETVPYPPRVNLEKPFYSQDYVEGEKVIFLAKANDDDGNISKVEFFINENKVGESHSAPFTDTVLGVAAGKNIEVTAKAYDNDDMTRTSLPEYINVYSSSTPKELQVYSVIPGGIETSDIEVYANGQQIPVEDLDGTKRIYVSRFAFGGKVDIKVVVTDPQINGYSIKPVSHNIQGEVKNNELHFSLVKPERLVVRINKYRDLCIFADAIIENAPDTSDADVYDAVIDFGIDNNGNYTYNELQSAIDSISAWGGGTLYLRDGVYKGHEDYLDIRSNVTMYLEPNVLITGCKIQFVEASHAKMWGHGAIDSDSIPIDGSKAGIFITQKSNHILVDGIFLRHLRGFTWCAIAIDSRYIKFINYKIVSSKDGSNTVNSSYVQFNNSYILSHDDCVAVKNLGGEPRISHDVHINNSIMECTRYGAIKLGTETNGSEFYNISYRDIDILDGARAHMIIVRDGAHIHHLTAENITVEKIGKPFHYIIEERGGLGKIDSVFVQNYNSWNKGYDSSVLQGFDSDHQIQHLFFEDVYLNGNPVEEVGDACFITNSFYNDVNFSFTNKRIPVENLGSYKIAQSSNWGTEINDLYDDNSSSMAKISGATSAWVEFDFGEEMNLIAARVHGDDNEKSAGWTMEAWNGSEYDTLFHKKYCYGNLWFEESITVTTQKVKITFHNAGGSDLAVGEIDFLTVNKLMVDNKNVSKKSDMGSDVYIYPNPTEGMLHIEGNDDITRIEIYNTNGQLVLSKKIESPSDPIHLSDLYKGMYFIKMIKGGQPVTKKLIIR